MKSYYLHFFVSNILFCQSTSGSGVFYAGKSFKRPAINSALQSESLRLENLQSESLRLESLRSESLRLESLRLESLQLERQLESLQALGSTIFRLFIV